MGKRMGTRVIPNPGSDEAIRQGCSCPVMDNCHGWGTLMYGEGTFWFDPKCPLHCKPVHENIARQYRECLEAHDEQG